MSDQGQSVIFRTTTQETEVRRQKSGARIQESEVGRIANFELGEPESRVQKTSGVRGPTSGVKETVASDQWRVARDYRLDVLLCAYCFSPRPRAAFCLLHLVCLSPISHLKPNSYPRLSAFIRGLLFSASSVMNSVFRNFLLSAH